MNQSTGDLNRILTNRAHGAHCTFPGNCLNWTVSSRGHRRLGESGHLMSIRCPQPLEMACVAARAMGDESNCHNHFRRFTSHSRFIQGKKMCSHMVEILGRLGCFLPYNLSIHPRSLEFFLAEKGAHGYCDDLKTVFSLVSLIIPLLTCCEVRPAQEICAGAITPWNNLQVLEPWCRPARVATR